MDEMQVKLSTKKSFNNWVKVGESDKGDVKFLIDYPTREQKEMLDDILFRDAKNQAQQLKYYRYYLKYTIKDWQGLDSECKVFGDELEDETWWSLVEDIKQTIDLFAKVSSELEFEGIDKKKLN